LKILNLYAGIGGNRKLWSDEHEITAVELDPNIAKIYQDLYPDDNVIIDDAHEFLRKHFREFDFIWASPPCPTHSVLQLSHSNDKNLKYPDMTLYQEIILLNQFYKGVFCIENVKPYYKPLIEPSFNIGRHLFWCNKFILACQFENFYKKDVSRDNKKELAESLGFNISLLENRGVDVRKVLRNCVVPEIGKYIFDELTRSL
jgi:DNA (cytosine-5)-methyltransferase 1